MPSLHPVALAGTALLGLLLFGLGFAVSALRGKYGIGVGYPDDPTHALHRVVRAHGNTAEYAPFLAVVFVYLGSRPQPAWVLWTIGVAAVCRLLIVVGLVACETMARPNPLRFIGALGTYLAGLALALAVLASAWGVP